MMDIICTKCGTHFDSVEGCKGHVGHCEAAPAGKVLQFLPAKGSKISQAEWGELLEFVNSLGTPAKTAEARGEVESPVAIAGKAKAVKPKMFRTVLGVLLLLGSVVLMYYHAALSAVGYQAGFLVIAGWVLGFASLGCFVWARRKFLPLVFYGVCMLWLLFAGGSAYVWVYVILLVIAFFMALMGKKIMATAKKRAGVQASSIAVSPNATCPWCRSKDIKVVGAGVSAKYMCANCGKIFPRGSGTDGRRA
jgi:DNA-directed RNA polymerase subunit RPC12/RpoP